MVAHILNAPRVAPPSVTQHATKPKQPRQRLPPALCSCCSKTAGGRVSWGGLVHPQCETTAGAALAGAHGRGRTQKAAQGGSPKTGVQKGPNLIVKKNLRQTNGIIHDMYYDSHINLVRLVDSYGPPGARRRSMALGGSRGGDFLTGLKGN